MVGEAQQAADLTQHPGIHWNHHVPPSPDIDINYLNE